MLAAFFPLTCSVKPFYCPCAEAAVLYTWIVGKKVDSE